MAGEKRSFPYYTPIPDIEIKRRAQDRLNPGQETSGATVYQQPNINHAQTSAATNFDTWTDSQIKGFLEQRGEDFEDCQTRQQLMKRAAECEFTTGAATKPVDAEGQDEDEDPLDAFMAEMQQLESKQSQQPKTKKAELEEEEDNVADFMEAREQNGGGIVIAEGYNSDDEVYATEKALQQAAGGDEDNVVGKQEMGPLAPLEHDSIDYEPFAKDFYTPAAKIAAMTPAQVNSIRRQLGMRVSGFDTPGPVESFEQCCLSAALMLVIKKAGYQAPTAIQAQALPAALSGRDVLGIAKTGSGKTAAFVIPMVVHVQDQPVLEKGEGPIGVIVAPTRELAEQIHKEARRFSKPFNMRIAAGIGGLSKFEQFKDLKAGSDGAVCTPGRLIDLIKMKGCTLRRTTYIVFDEADRMFDMGFESQVRSIIGQIRPDRQTLLFSATMPTKVERLVRDALTSPVRITVGEVGAANEDIKQVVDIVEEQLKLEWLLRRLPEMVDAGEVLVFANQISRVEEVTEKVKTAGFRATAIHGDMDQHTRVQALKAFSSGKQHVLVATDVAARGLDIKSIKNVVNFDAAKDIDTHVHRVGRTGRAGDKEGTAYTLLDPKQSHFAGLLVNSMGAANQEISPALQSLALKDPRFRKGQTRNKAGGKFSASGRKQRQQVGGAGIGFGPDDREDVMEELYGNRSGFGKSSEPKKAGPSSQGAAPAGFVKASTPEMGSRQTVLTAVPPSPATPPPPPAAAAAGDPAQPAGGVFGGQGLRGIMQNRFRSQFVTTGTTGGDVGQKATIIAPKQARQVAQALDPAPSFLAKKPAQNKETAQQAIAAARAIAARLASGGSAQQSEPPPDSRPPMLRSAPGEGRRQHPAGLGASASAYPDLSVSEPDERSPSRHSESGRKEGRSRGAPRSSEFGGVSGYSSNVQPDTSGDRGRGLSSVATAPLCAPTPQASPYSAQYGSYQQAAQPAAPQPPPQDCPAPSVQQPNYAPPPGPAGSQASIQASIAAAQAIAARFAARGAPSSAAPNPQPPGRLGPAVGGAPPGGSAPDSVQASIEAAKAIASRFSSRGGGPGGGPPPSALGNHQPSSSGQWAWGRG